MNQLNMFSTDPKLYKSDHLHQSTPLTSFSLAKTVSTLTPQQHHLTLASQSLNSFINSVSISLTGSIKAVPQWTPGFRDTQKTIPHKAKPLDVHWLVFHLCSHSRWGWGGGHVSLAGRRLPKREKTIACVGRVTSRDRSPPHLCTFRGQWAEPRLWDSLFSVMSL